MTQMIVTGTCEYKPFAKIGNRLYGILGKDKFEAREKLCQRKTCQCGNKLIFNTKLS